MRLQFCLHVVCPLSIQAYGQAPLHASPGIDCQDQTLAQELIHGGEELRVTCFR